MIKRSRFIVESNFDEHTLPFAKDVESIQRNASIIATKLDVFYIELKLRIVIEDEPLNSAEVAESD
ncbi:MAG: hypothetical protein MUO26_15720 [Methanotrichaceae archaeon]|nr:hypothetical protein [Methanotrichaceae archaeon]